MQIQTSSSQPSRLRLGLTLSLALLLALAVAGGLALSARTARQSGPAGPRDITLTARDMAFYLPGDSTPNPTIVVARGEKVRLTLVNQDLGMRHDFAVAALDLSTETLDKVGETTTLEFEAPDEPGRQEYVCSFHEQMMKGVLRVE
jgi:plastocyanin